MENQESNPRYQLHHLIGQRERAEKRWNNGNPNAEEDYLRYKKEVEELLIKNPELQDKVEGTEEYFFKQLYS